MEYRRNPLFPKHEGLIQLPVFIREISDPSNEGFYVVWVHISGLHKDGPNCEAFKIWHYELSRVLSQSTLPKSIVDLNQISDLALTEFVFVDDGSFCADRLNLNSIPVNMRNAQRLVGKQLFNLSNIYAPLKVYRLRRVMGKTCSEKSTSGNITRTFWDTEVLDHSKNVPCARSGHSVLVDSKNKRLFLIGGVTILADKTYETNIDDIDNNWFYHSLNDIWSLDLQTGNWDRMMDLNFKPEMPLSRLPKVLSKGFKLPDFLADVSLVYDYNNDLIYGCYSALESAEIDTKRRSTILFSFDLLDQCVRLESTYNETGPSTLQIAYDYSKLIVHFPSSKKAGVCVIPSTEADKAKCASLDRKLLPRRKLRGFKTLYPLRIVGDNLCCVIAQVAVPSEDRKGIWETSKISYMLPNGSRLRNLIK